MTMGLSRLQYTTSKTFNKNLRSYVTANNEVLFDIASIVSRLPNGEYCYYSRANSTTPLPNEIPNMCDEYTDEVNGGHLNGYGKARVSQALWAFMARLAGWNGVLQ